MAELSFVEREMSGWGRLAPRTAAVARPQSAAELDTWIGRDNRPYLAVGARRSYGDTCANDGGPILDLTALNRFQGFDRRTGVLTADAGVLLGDLMQVMVPKGWFPATTPGTRQVTLGGAVANDVHGKNHGKAGAFGTHVLAIELLRSDTGRRWISADSEPELFAATIGGLGLTGIICSVTLQLVPIASAYLHNETLPFANLGAFFDLSRSSEAFEHTVAWIDCTARGPALGKGVFHRADWAADGRLEPHRGAPKSLPLPIPDGLLNPLTLKAFNTLYDGLQRAKPRRSTEHYAQVFHPLDGLDGWNRFYGKAGFYQYQCVTPEGSETAVRELLAVISQSGEGSFLAVLKAFGARPSPGLLSFPMAGYTLALDFRNRGAETLRLLERLDQIVSVAGGRLYPAKDARMSRVMFEAGYPRLDEFRRFRDPLCQSDFAKRMML
ncbi:MAG TPA: FAD-binding oxidoreductase [Caulobacteraceae bacterium]|jgi:L-gulonolactone oxidase